jgi:peptidoglycan/xylan/chitin deacetylase (PgdA/CDA1 family)
MFAMTLDLEPDYAGLMPERFDLLDKIQEIEEILFFLKEKKIPLTVFVTGRIIEKKPETVNLFREFECEFHSHGYSHFPDEADDYEEIKKGKILFRDHFGYDPIGYRAPDGKITKKAIKNLEKLGFKFDSSVFPSFWPNPFKYFHLNDQPFFIYNSRILEIPFSVLYPLRTTFSLSYIKFIGYNINRYFFNRFKQRDIIVFDSHLHDFIQNNLYKMLSPFWRFIYSRNNINGLNYLKKTIDLVLKNNYSFVKINDIYRKFMDNKK